MTNPVDRDFLNVIYSATLADGLALYERIYKQVMTDDDNTLSHARFVQLDKALKALLDGDLELAREHALTLAALTPAPPNTETP